MADKSPIKQKDYNVLKEVAKANNFSLRDLMAVYSLESDSGQDATMNGGDFNRGAHHGPFQFDKTTAKEYKLKNVYDLKGSAEAHIRLVNDRKGDVQYYLNRDKVSGKPLNKLSSSTFNYLLHQQGAQGVANLAQNIANPLTSVHPAGIYEGNSRRNMLSNLYEDQQKHFIKNTATVPEATKYFLSSIEENLASIRKFAAEQDIKFTLPPPVQAVLDSAAIDTFLTKEP